MKLGEVYVNITRFLFSVFFDTCDVCTVCFTNVLRLTNIASNQIYNILFMAQQLIVTNAVLRARRVGTGSERDRQGRFSDKNRKNVHRKVSSSK